MVATSQPLAAQAGLEILKKGGNAIDAAIATAACLTVVEPTSNGIGSDAFALVWTQGKLHGLNASGKSPASISIEKVKAMGFDEMPKTAIRYPLPLANIGAERIMRTRVALRPMKSLHRGLIRLHQVGALRKLVKSGLLHLMQQHLQKLAQQVQSLSIGEAWQKKLSHFVKNTTAFYHLRIWQISRHNG